MSLEKINELVKELGLKANKVWIGDNSIIYRFWLLSVERISEVVKPLGLKAVAVWSDPTSLFCQFEKIDIKEEVKEIEPEPEIHIKQTSLDGTGIIKESEIKDEIVDEIDENVTDVDELVEDFAEDVGDIIKEEVVETVKEMKIPIPPEKAERVKELLEQLEE